MDAPLIPALVAPIVDALEVAPVLVAGMREPELELEAAAEELLPRGPDDDVLIGDPFDAAGHWHTSNDSPPLAQIWTPESPPTQAHETSCPGVQSGFDVEHPAPISDSAIIHFTRILLFERLPVGEAGSLIGAKLAQMDEAGVLSTQ